MDMEMSMDIIEMARDLGRALQADEKYQRYVNATLEMTRTRCCRI